MKIKVARGRLPTTDGIKIIGSVQDCVEMVRELMDAPAVGVDTETVGVDITEYHPVGKVRAISAQFATDDKAWFVPLWGEYSANLKPMKEFVESEKENKVLANAKFDWHVFANHGMRPKGLLADTIVVDFLYDSGAMSHGLKECMRRYFNEELAIDYKGVFAVSMAKKNGEESKKMRIPTLDEVIMSSDGVKKLVDYAIKDPIYTLRLYKYLREKMESIKWKKGKSYWEYYVEFDRPYTEVLFDIERRGCRVDIAMLEIMKTSMEADVVSIQNEFASLSIEAGVPQSFIGGFNMGSTVQVAKLIENHLGLKIVERTEKGNPSTDDSSLQKIKARGREKRIIELLLEMRRTKKLLTTYAEPMIEYAEMYGGKIHTEYRQTGTISSRLSSAKPNLQQVPTSAKDKYGIRKAFIAEPGCLIGDIDLSQIEMRLTAHFSQDAMMVKAIENDWDLHSLTAVGSSLTVARWVEENAKEINAETLHEIKELFPNERKNAKILNFGWHTARAEVKSHQNGELFAVMAA